jgi:excinuclease UvrABC nuclease subunit
MPFEQVVPRALTMNQIRRFAPSQPGVYGISNAQEWIYIGETDNIQQALLQHIEDSANSLMVRRPTGFVFEVCREGMRPARQDRLVREYEPVCNRLSQAEGPKGRHPWEPAREMHRS